MLGEIGILVLSSLKLNCSNISDCIFDDTYGLDEKKILEYQQKTTKFFNDGGICNRREIENPLNELLHIFLIDDYIPDSSDFVKNSITLAQKYYKNSDRLQIILDFGLSESDSLCCDEVYKLLQLNNIKKLYVTNCLNIDFCEYNDLIKKLYIDKNEIKTLCEQ